MYIVVIKSEIRKDRTEFIDYEIFTYLKRFASSPALSGEHGIAAHGQGFCANNVFESFTASQMEWNPY